MLIHTDGFDYVGVGAGCRSALTARGWLQADFLSDAAPRFATPGLAKAVVGTNALANLSWPLTGSPSLRWTLGYGQLLQFTGQTMLAAANADGDQFYVKINNSGQAELRLADDTLLATSTAAFAMDAWYFVEVQFVCVNETGLFILHVDGEEWMNLVNQNLAFQGSAGVTVVRLINYVGQAIDDLYLLNDDETAEPTDFLGDHRIITKAPDGDHGTPQWTPSGAGSNYAQIDDIPLAGSDYVKSATSGERDLYNFANEVDTALVVVAVTHAALAYKDDVGARAVDLVVRTGGAVYVGDTFSLSASPQYVQQIRTTDPDTSVAWTISGVNAAQFGQDVSV